MIIRDVVAEAKALSSIGSLFLEEGDVIFCDNLVQLTGQQVQTLANKIKQCEGKKGIVIGNILIPSRLFQITSSFFESEPPAAIFVALGKRKPKKRFTPAVAIYPTGRLISGAGAKHLLAEMTKSLVCVFGSPAVAEEALIYAATFRTREVHGKPNKCSLSALSTVVFPSMSGITFPEGVGVSSPFEALGILKNVKLTSLEKEKQAAWLDQVSDSFFNKHGGENSGKEA